MKKDPYQEREAKKYAHPVPSREFIIESLKVIDEPVTLRHLLSLFELEDDPERKEGLRRRLRAMQRDGQLMQNRRGKYALVEAMDLVDGYVQGNKEGFGFLLTQDGSDIFLPAREMRTVFPADRVLVRVVSKDKRQRREGVIVEILESNTQTLVGRLYQEQGALFLDPYNKKIAQDVIIPPDEQGAAQPGQYVLVAIISQPTRRRQPTARVMNVLGDHLTPGVEVELSIRAHNIPFEWPDAVILQAKQFATEIQAQDCQGRQDFRQLPFLTIDGEDAQDFDDAVYCEQTPEGWILYVAIADVSHYVQPDSSLDLEARNRGNSLYFPARVVPMLPEILSNELCSLKPHVDRLALVCEMQLNQQAEVIRHQFHEAVIRSCARLTYNTVAAWLSGDLTPDPNIFPHIKTLYQLSTLLLKRKKMRAAIELETTESRVLFSQDGKINRIIPVERNEAHKLIEEIMLLANVTTAHFLQALRLPTLYRVHNVPNEDKLLALRTFLKPFGLRLTGGKNPKGKDYANLLRRIAKRPDAHLLQWVILRSLPQALYSPDNQGHFGLSYDAYCHFTSPIRRYPDLLVHRAIRHVLTQPAENTPFIYTKEQMHTLAEHCSSTERRADLATRDALDWLKCDYMQDKLGQEFDALIMDVTGFGLFVELNTIYVQGLLHISALPNDYYDYDNVHHLLIGRHSGKRYRLGDEIRVLVAAVDLDQRKIDFDLAESAATTGASRRKRRA